jgi:uncharacterized membrane protein HdeD (DUF308 family)
MNIETGGSSYKAPVVWSVVMIILGLLAIASPFAGSIAGEVLVACLLLVSGVAHVVVAVGYRRIGSFTVKLLVGIAYLLGGGAMLLFPVAGLASLTLFVAVLFFLEGILEIVAYFVFRPLARATWLVVDGIVSVVLGVLLLANWPASAFWAIGVLIGVNLLISGSVRLALYAALRADSGSMP